jgi:protoporphyrinogen/coproporphyrinogen III oxidase
MTRPASVAVVGGGIAGLVAAYRLGLRENGDRPPSVTVFEAGGRTGGKLHTIELAGMPVEAGADSFVVRKPWAIELCKELGLGEDLVKPGAEGAFVWTGGRLVAFPERSAFGIPAGAGEVLKWPGLSWNGRVRALIDLYRPASKGDVDSSLGAMIRRRLGPEALRVLVGPLLSGIHAGDPDRMSVAATFPELLAWERGRGSLLRGARAAWKSAEADRGPLFATLWHGLSSLVDTLESSIGPDRIRVGRRVDSVRRDGHGFLVEAAGEGVRVDAVVLATSAIEAAGLVKEVSRRAADVLAAIPYVSTAAVFLVYPEATGDRLPARTGFVVPLGERTIAACTFLSRKWPREEYGGRAVVRCFVGRAGAEEALALDDEELVKLVAAEVGKAVGLEARPDHAQVVRWPQAMPQYEVGHLERVRTIEQTMAATAPGLFVTGSAYRGVGVADCVRQANETADLVRAHLQELEAHGPAGGESEAMSWRS